MTTFSGGFSKKDSSPQMTTEASESLQIVPPTVPPLALVVPRKKRRGKRRDPLRGFSLCKPQPAHGQPFWRVKYGCPELAAKGIRKDLFRRIPAEHGGDPSDQPKGAADKRQAFRADLAREIGDRKRELAAGRAEPVIEADALIEPAIEEHYFQKRALRRRSETIRTYRCAIRAFLAWCALAGVRTCRQLTAAKLAEYREHAAARPKDDGELREGKSVNNELKAVGTILRALAKQKRLILTGEQILATLEKEESDDDGPGPIHLPEALRAIIAACIQHDEALRIPLAKPRRGRPRAMRDLLPTFLFFLLTGLRPKEAYGIEWTDVAVGNHGALEITVRKEVSKTRRERKISCGHSPLLAHLVGNHARRTGRILPGSKHAWERSRERLVEQHGAPAFTSRELRRTCGTFLACAPSIFHAASAYLAARQLGHSVKIAEQHYLGVVPVSVDATTTEAAMQLKIANHAAIPQL